MLNGTTEEALNFYKETLGGEINEMGKYGDSPAPCDEVDKNKIMHAVFEFDNNKIMFSDTQENKKAVEGNNIHLSLDVEDAQKLNIIFAAMAENGKVTMELQDTFWGARFGMLTDKFGLNWMFNHDYKK